METEGGKNVSSITSLAFLNGRFRARSMLNNLTRPPQPGEPYVEVKCVTLSADAGDHPTVTLVATLLGIGMSDGADGKV